MLRSLQGRGRTRHGATVISRTEQITKNPLASRHFWSKPFGLTQNSAPTPLHYHRSAFTSRPNSIRLGTVSVLGVSGSELNTSSSLRQPLRRDCFLDCRKTQVRAKVFVSRHNTTLNVTASQILEQCSHHGISEQDTRTSHTHVILKECPFCSKPTNNKADNLYKLYISIGGGAYFCHRCGAQGSWYDFKLKLGGYDVVTATDKGRSMHAASLAQAKSTANPYSMSATNSNRTLSNTKCLPMPEKRLQAAYITRLMDQQNPESIQGLLYLNEVRGLNKQTLRKYGVGLGVYKFPSSDPDHPPGHRVEAECITFPWIMRASEVAEQENLRGASYAWENDDEEEQQPKEAVSAELVQEANGPFVTRRIKARALHNKAWQRLDPTGGGWGLFGHHTIPPDATEIVITEGEYDAMAVYQATEMPAVSLPNGCRSLPVEVLPLLEKFEKIYLWMDNDGPGQEGAENFAKKLGLNRCVIVKPTMSDPPKDANEALLKGFNIKEMLEEASILPHERIMQFSELRTQVLHEITHPDKYVGVPVPSLPGFTSIVKGFRRGELTVLTGPTGSGKTTFLGQMSLDFAEQGINTLWGSFEIKNTRLMHKLLQQYSRAPLPVGKPESVSALEAVADRFEQLPLFFMKFHGGSDVDDVLDAMDYAAYVHDVEHVILDNLQFMISRNTPNGSFDKFDMQDIAVEKFRKFATDKNVHVTLVVHPRKEDEGAKLGISSIYGTAKATQEADTVLILQNDGRRKYMEVKKNRFDGSLGYSPLHFRRASGRYLETPEMGTSSATPIKSTSPTAKPSASSTPVHNPPKATSGSEPNDLESHWDSILEPDK